MKKQEQSNGKGDKSRITDKKKFDIQDTREKVLQKKNKLNKPNKKGHQENVKRDKKNSWNNRSSQL